MPESVETEAVKEEIVRSLFTIFMTRAPSEAETKTLARSIADLGSLPPLIAKFALSGEFKARQAKAVPIFVPPGHFYSPVVDPSMLGGTISRQRAAPDPKTLSGLRLDIGEMTRFWREELLPHIKEIPFSDEPDGYHRYHYRNPAFAHGDGTTLYAMLQRYKPPRVIEVGSGYSSTCLLDASTGPKGFPCEITFIEPHPKLLKSLIRPEDSERVIIREQSVESVPLECFEKLEDGDFLFIDSTHVMKTGSDVTFELTEILPRLKPGVFVHFHDIFYPFEYGYEWAVVENRSWNEIYGLRAFLTFNEEYEVVFFNDMFCQLRPEIIRADCPNFLKNSGGSIWLRRRCF